MRSSVGPYDIIDLIGRGGMGVVYLAEDSRLGRRIAIKMLGEVREQSAHARLWREARAAASLNHPGICQVFDVGEVDEGGLWIAMELLEGEGLSDRLARDRLGTDEAVAITRGILSPLGFLHRRGFVHRDLKPSNIFLTAHGVKLLDFGLARPIAPDDDDVGLTRTGAIVGSPRYMAPEQWDGAEVGPPADLFACGAILFEMLAGQPAFPGETPMAVFRAVAVDEPPSLAEHAQGGEPVVTRLDGVVARALARETTARYDSAEALSAALDEACAAWRHGDTLQGGTLETEAARPEVVRREPVASGPVASGPAASVPLAGKDLERFIAVPFRLLRPDSEIDFLSSSLPEAIGSSLSGLEHLVVRSTRLAQRPDGASADLRRLAAEAEVDLVLEGTLMRAGERVRLSAQLVRVPAGTVEWSLTEQASVGDLFELQDDLTRRVVESLSVPLSARDRARLRHDVPATARAYELYLRALHAGATATATAAAAGATRDLYRACLDEDPGFAPAWAGYARTCRMMAKYGFGEPDEHQRLAGEAFRRAFELDPDSPLAHSFYTHFQIQELGDSVGAMERLLAQLHARSSDPELFSGLCAATRFCGLYDASVAAHERARELDPRIVTSVAHTYFVRGDYPLAAEFEAPPGLYLRPLAPAMLGDEEGSRAAFQDPETHAEGMEARIRQAAAATLQGQRDLCERTVDLLLDDLGEDPEGILHLAFMLARVDAVDMALDLLERVIDGAYFCVLPLRAHPWLESVRGHDRFRAVLANAEAGRTSAAAAFRRADGERLLGVGVEGAGS